MVKGKLRSGVDFSRRIPAARRRAAGVGPPIASFSLACAYPDSGGWDVADSFVAFDPQVYEAVAAWLACLPVYGIDADDGGFSSLKVSGGVLVVHGFRDLHEVFKVDRVTGFIEHRGIRAVLKAGR